MSSGRVLSDTTKAQIRALAAQEPQPSAREIARQAGCSATSVGRILHAEGLLRPAAQTKSRGHASDPRSVSFLFARLDNRNADPAGYEAAFANKPLPPGATADAIIGRQREAIQRAIAARRGTIQSREDRL